MLASPARRGGSSRRRPQPGSLPDVARSGEGVSSSTLAALLRASIAPKRRGCRPLSMSDKIGLSDVFASLSGWTIRRPTPRPAPRPKAAAARRDKAPSPRLPALLPSPPPPALSGLAETARAQNTRRAYNSHWRHFASWCRRGFEADEPDPQTVGLYLARQQRRHSKTTHTPPLGTGLRC